MLALLTMMTFERLNYQLHHRFHQLRHLRSHALTDRRLEAEQLLKPAYLGSELLVNSTTLDKDS